MINLLPDSEKKELIKIEKEKIQIIILVLLNFFLICLILLSLFLNIYFNSQLRTKQSLIESLKEFEKDKEFEKEIEEINEELVKINNFFQEKVYYSEVLKEIIEALPKDAHLDRFSFSENKASLDGFILSREDLLIFQERLQERFQEVNFPPLNWVERKNINFFVTFLI